MAKVQLKQALRGTVRRGILRLEVVKSTSTMVAVPYTRKNERGKRRRNHDLH